MDNLIGFENFDKEFFHGELERSLTKEIEMIKVAQDKGGDKPFYLYRNSVKWLTLKMLDGGTDLDTLRHYFKLAMQGIYGHIRSLDNNGKPLKLWVADKEVELTNTSTGYDKVFTLMGAYIYASICRCEQVTDLILNLEENSTFLNYGEHEHHPTYKMYPCHAF